MAARAKPSLDQGLLFDAKSDWELPTELPDLSLETEIAIDTETRDPSLAADIGPGFFKYEKNDPNTGFICGISLAWRSESIYIPLRHERKTYFETNRVQTWLKGIIGQSCTRFVFHNFQYDWGWIEAVFNIKPPVLVDDTAAMASMLNENLDSFALDDLCRWQGLPGKDERVLEEASALRGIKRKDIKQFLYELPVQFVGPYAEQDARSTLMLAQVLRPQLTEENLDYAYQIERDLLPITLKMKQHGIRVDTKRAEKLADDILAKCREEEIQISSALGKRVTIKDIRSSRWLQMQFDEMGLEYPRTARSEQFTEGQASFEKSFMSSHKHWFPRAVHKIKHQTDLAEKFLRKFILKYAYKGRVHPTVNQFRNEGGGARSHRFSYADPPLQQMPSRDDEYAALIRSCFLPEEGEQWYSIDYRQQEFRLIVFVAETLRAKGAKDAADRYRKDPSTDFHNYVAEITRLQRRRAKDVNFAKSYGAGVPKFALMTGMDELEARSVMEQYDKEMPFVREAAERYTNLASRHGFIRLLDRARNHFNLWEPVYRDFAREYEAKKKNPNISTLPCFQEEADRRASDPNHPWYYEKFKRAFCHKAFNRMIQGSAARQMKKAMVDIYNAGYLPLIQLHDELGLSLTDRSQALICSKLMEEAMPIITIPMLTDIEYGDNWGHLQK